MEDDRVCPICRAIDGYIWVFDGPPPDSLIHPTYGEVWNKTIGSSAHEHGSFGSCRCHIEPEIDMSDMVQKIRLLHDEIKAATDPKQTEPDDATASDVPVEMQL